MSKLPQCIVMMTDFGLHDVYVGQMKGVILSVAPAVQIIDLTHGVSPQNIVQGAFYLAKSLPFLPERSIVVSVVDPGVGSARRAIALETDNHTFLAPDNGLLSAVFNSQKIRQCVAITEERYLRVERSATFHGRDVFSCAAGHLACGVSVQALGEVIDPADCIRISMPECNSFDNGESWVGSIMYSDHFGNLVTSIDSKLFDNRNNRVVSVGEWQGIPVVCTYSDVADKQLLAYTGSSDMIEIAVRNGHAALTLGVKEGDRVILTIR